jgi:hypothetical protein
MNLGALLDDPSPQLHGRLPGPSDQQYDGQTQIFPARVREPRSFRGHRPIIETELSASGQEEMWSVVGRPGLREHSVKQDRTRPGPCNAG